MTLPSLLLRFSKAYLLALFASAIAMGLQPEAGVAALRYPLIAWAAYTAVNAFCEQNGRYLTHAEFAIAITGMLVVDALVTTLQFMDRSGLVPAHPLQDGGVLFAIAISGVLHGILVVVAGSGVKVELERALVTSQVRHRPVPRGGKVVSQGGKPPEGGKP